MSSKTNFKRIALVAVTALATGVLSSAPSQAAIVADTFTVTTTAGTATRAVSDSTTAATLTVKFLSTAADTVSIVIAAKSVPSLATTTPSIDIFGGATGIANGIGTGSGVDTSTSTGATGIGTNGGSLTANDTALITGVANTYSSAKFLISMDSTTAGAGVRTAGTYVYTAIVTGYAASGQVGIAQTITTKTVDITFTIAAEASQSLVASPANSSAILSAAGGAAADEAVNAVATTSTAPIALIEIKLRNANSATAGTAAKESVTVTTTAGTVGITGGAFGRSVILPYAGGSVTATESLTVYVRGDGTNGTATINISTASVTFAPKTMVFYATAPSTLVATTLNTTMGTGSNSAAIGVVAKDATGNTWAGTLYTYSDTVGTVSDTGTSCSYVAANSRHECISNCNFCCSRGCTS